MFLCACLLQPCQFSSSLSQNRTFVHCHRSLSALSCPVGASARGASLLLFYHPILYSPSHLAVACCRIGWSPIIGYHRSLSRLSQVERMSLVKCEPTPSEYVSYTPSLPRPPRRWPYVLFTPPSVQRTSALLHVLFTNGRHVCTLIREYMPMAVCRIVRNDEFTNLLSFLFPIFKFICLWRTTALMISRCAQHAPCSPATQACPRNPSYVLCHGFGALLSYSLVLCLFANSHHPYDIA